MVVRLWSRANGPNIKMAVGVLTARLFRWSGQTANRRGVDVIATGDLCLRLAAIERRKRLTAHAPFPAIIRATAVAS